MILLDTNVVSELMKAEPSPGVLAWIDAAPAAALFASAITQGEILYGVALLPSGKIVIAKSLLLNHPLHRLLAGARDRAPRLVARR